MKKLGMLLMLLLAITMQSYRALAQSVTITLMPGWNWISVPLMDTLDFETAMDSVTPAVGDIIKSRWGAATYTGDGQWRGTISEFYPGYGYHYKSNRTMPVTVIFTAQHPDSQVIVTTTEPTDITTHSVTCGGNVTSSSGDYVFVTLRGICWSTNPNPTFNDNYMEVGNGLGNFTTAMEDLTPNTTYYIRAFAVTASGTYYGDEKTLHTIPIDAIIGLFSVNPGRQVYFSKGNLQYQAFTNIWRFATNQYDCIGSNNSNISSSYSDWIDLFGWGTSGYNHGANCYQPWSTSSSYSDYYAYGNLFYNLYDQTGQADWGYNPISNGGNMVNQWRTLTKDEWGYVFYNRTTTSGIRYAKAKVNNVNGVILLPDDWNASTYSLSNTNNSSAGFNSNTITATEWTTLEDAGAVFLPAAGYRVRTSVYNVGSDGGYWSASYYGGDLTHCVYFSGNNLMPGNYNLRYYGRSVRLVRNAE